jgi:hypothetical protein
MDGIRYSLCLMAEVGISGITALVSDTGKLA